MFNSIVNLLLKFRTEEQCIEFLESKRWPEGQPVSPFISWEKVYKLKHHRYKGVISGKIFNVKTGTIFQGTKLPLLVWFSAIGLFCSAKKGISSYQMARDLNISQNTAYKLLMKIRSALGPDNDRILKGIVEVDEMFHGPKGDTRKKGIQKTPILGMVSNKGFTMKVVDDVSKKSIYPVIDDYIKKGTTIFTDEFTTYNSLIRFGYYHYSCNHDKKIWVDKKTLASTNRIENLWRHFRALLRNYNTVSKKYLQNYVDEYCFRGNNRNLKWRQMFNKVLLLALQ